MGDIAAELTNSLDRTGRGGMSAPFRIFDGTITQPGLSFNNETGLGLWRSGSGVMQLVAGGTNYFRVDSVLGAAVSPLKLAIYGEHQIRAPGQKWWQVKNGGGMVSFTPSTTADAEDWDSAHGFAINTDGNVSLSGVLTCSQILIPPTIDISANGATISSLFMFIGSTGAISADTGESHKLEVKSAGGVGDAAFMAFHRAGLHAAIFGIDTDNKWKVGGWSMGVNAYQILHENNSFIIDAFGNLNAGGKFVQSNAFGAGYTFLGTHSGELNPGLYQTYGMNVGSNVSSIIRIPGQVFRFLVIGNGPIILPPYVKLASGTAWGTTYSMVSMWTDGTTIWGTVTPYST